MIIQITLKTIPDQSLLNDGGKISQNRGRPIYCIWSPRLPFANRAD